jgi:hypothetical protein
MPDQDPVVHQFAHASRGACRSKLSQLVVALGAPRTPARDEEFVESSVVRTTAVRSAGEGLCGKMLGLALVSFALVAGGLAWLSSRSTEAASPSIALDLHKEFTAPPDNPTVLRAMVQSTESASLAPTNTAAQSTEPRRAQPLAPTRAIPRKKDNVSAQPNSLTRTPLDASSVRQSP